MKASKPVLPRFLLLASRWAGLMVGSSAMAAVLVLALPCCRFWPMVAIIAVCLLTSTPKAMKAYTRSLRHTESHRRYLLANGATRHETLLPSVRRAVRVAVLPLLPRRRQATMMVALPVFFFTLLSAGTAFWQSLLATALLWVAVFFAALLAFALSVCLYNLILVDKQGTFTAPAGKP